MSIIVDYNISGTLERGRIQSAYERVRDDLLARRTEKGHWVGRLSSSALSTSTAVSALSLYLKNIGEPSGKEKKERLSALIHDALSWLLADQNPDGGWGDTPESPSNISTTILVKCAIHLAQKAEDYSQELFRADAFIEKHGGIEGIPSRYGSDRTFSVPILTNCALAGLISWDQVPALPFELAAFPQSFFRMLHIPVVSYAIPALVAIGRVHFEKCPPKSPLRRFFRGLLRNRTLEKVRIMQPESGGFLEAAPLTAFVVMGLSESGSVHHRVVENGVRFLLGNVRTDGSWPVDTNLAIWGTTLSLNALCNNTSVEKKVHESERIEYGEKEKAVFLDPELRDWILSSQHRTKHPFTGARPGGWAWTDLSGGVPDADDTSGALLALRTLYEVERDDRIALQVFEGLRWLLALQNRDGGWPTFCKGWNRFPFDRSGVDLSAHALRALIAWKNSDLPVLEKHSGSSLETEIRKSVQRGIEYILRSQSPDGSWLPLWFGNQYHPREENPFYATAKVLRLLDDFLNDGDFYELFEVVESAIFTALKFLCKSPNPDGGFGFADSGIEETALVVDAVAPFVRSSLVRKKVPGLQEMYKKALRKLLEIVESGEYPRSSPIGLYFTKLWYDEELYPVIFTTSALGQALRFSD